MRKTGVVAAAIIAVCGAAAAEPADWSGPYVGLVVSNEGGDQQYFDNDVPRPGPTFPTYLSGTTSGAFAGYNFQNGALVYGIEAEKTSGSVAYGPFPDNRHSDFTEARVRAGYAAGKVLFYGAVGVSSSTWVENTVDEISAEGQSFALGIDAQLGQNMLLGVEEMRRNLDSENFNVAPQARFEGSFDSVRLRLGVRF